MYKHEMTKRVNVLVLVQNNHLQLKERLKSYWHVLLKLETVSVYNSYYVEFFLLKINNRKMSKQRFSLHRQLLYFYFAITQHPFSEPQERIVVSFIF